MSRTTHRGTSGAQRSVLLRLIDNMAARNLMVVGDLVLDEYVIGSAGRISREAPIPVLEFLRRDVIPGGAANPAVNVAAFRSGVIQVGVVGADPNADLLRQLLDERGINTGALVIDPERQTTTKTRIMAHMGLRFPQQVARIDRIDRRLVTGATEKAVINCIHQFSDQVEAIMVSDYLNGLLTPTIVDAVRMAAHQAKKSAPLLISADAQGDLQKYADFDLVKCNADEARQYAAGPLHTDEDFAAVGQHIAAKVGPRRAILITRGPEGMTVIDARARTAERRALHIPAPTVEDVYDTVGAGDTVLAVMTLAMLAGGTLRQAATLANVAAGIVVRKVGNYAPSAAELRDALQSEG